DESPGSASAGQSAPFDEAHRAADGVELLDVGSDGAEGACEANLVVERDTRNGGGEKRRAAAGNQAEAEIVGFEGRNDLEKLAGAGAAFGARFVDTAGARGVQMNSLRGDDAIGRNIDPTAQLLVGHELRSDRAFEGNSHACGCFAGADNSDVADAAKI